MPEPVKEVGAMNHETLIAIMGEFDGSALTRLEYTQGQAGNQLPDPRH